jgi:putative membrane-bound dehydrogenase-like protein
MNIKSTSLVSLAISVLFTFSCSEKVEKPSLSYSGEEPRVQNPLSPEDSQKHIEVPKGFETILYAAEPNIINPIAFTWDERGRLWVVQSMDYPHKLADEVGGDRITICEDTDNDGLADKFTDFATNQSLSTGIVIVKGGAIVAQAPDMVFLEDTDGDDKMDKSTVLFGGFGTWDTHAGPSNLHYGPDNMIWGAVGYSGFTSEFQGKTIKFDKGVYRFSKDGSYFEPVGSFNNNTWGMGIGEDFEIFGSTANNNHCCYVGIPLRHYEYLEKRPTWAINADFIQGHYEITAIAANPLQQVDVRGGYTAAAGANLYTARNFPKKYWGQMLLNEPTGHLVHLANIVDKGAGFEEVDGGNLFASSDEWTAPVFAETGPDGNVWVADWYNPVIQHNPDKRGMENQIWNADKGEGNAHINPRRDLKHGRIYIVRPKRGYDSEITSLSIEDHDGLISGLKSDNMFWRTTAQRLIVENNLQKLIPSIKELISDKTMDSEGFNGAAMHALYTLQGLNALDEDLINSALNSKSGTVQKAAMALLPESVESSNKLAASGLLSSDNLHLRLAAILRSSELPETEALVNSIENAANNEVNKNDKWLKAALNIYYREQNTEDINPKSVHMLIPSSEEEQTEWKYIFEKPSENWHKPNFDDSSWSIGQGLFTGPGKLEKRMGTKWTTSDIWLRKEVVLEELIEKPVLKIVFDEDYEVYINGELLKGEEGWTSEYKYFQLDEEAGSLFKIGKNSIAVHCKNTNGDQHIDLGIGKIGAPKADVTLEINTVDQKMAYDKTELIVTAGQYVEIKLNNKDQMPHNLVVIQQGSLENFGALVDAFLKNPKAAEMQYVPNSRYVIGATSMIDPGEQGSVFFKVPDTPGRYPFVCTFPGHWRMMQGVLIVNPPGNFIATRKNAKKILTVGGGGSHDFLKFFGIADGKVLYNKGEHSIMYTENISEVPEKLKEADVLFMTNNQPYSAEAKKAIMSHANAGKGFLIQHPSTWYNWKDWPEYNKTLVGGGSKSHEKLQEFEVLVIKPGHPIMEGIPSRFKIIDELYRWEKDPVTTAVEVLAIGKSLETGKEYPVVWIVKHSRSKIVGNTLGHDERAHSLKPYQNILKNSLIWVLN